MRRRLARLRTQSVCNPVFRGASAQPRCRRTVLLAGMALAVL